MHLRGGDLRADAAEHAGPERLVHGHLVAFGHDLPPCRYAADVDFAANGHGGFEALEEEEDRLRLAPGNLTLGLPEIGEAAATGDSAQGRGDFGAGQRRCSFGGTVGHAEELDPGLRGSHAFSDQRHFGCLRDAAEFEQFNPVADRAKGADKIVADPRSDQGRQVTLHLHLAPPPDTAMTDMNAILSPGMIVRHPDRPDWGEGQVQSNVAGRITVNFREVGKVVINGTDVVLVIVSF